MTDLISDGENAIGVQVGEGWYAGRIGLSKDARNGWGAKLEVLALLVITDEDGERHLVRSDGEWESGYGAILASEIYDGEIFDFSKVQDGWSSADFSPTNGSEWAAVEETDWSLGLLVAPDGPPIRRTQTLKVQEILTTPSRKTILDFRQNFAG
ncbi:alpha-L-rhamnosidase N-terminal domain-containing protein [Candidatus Bathyarchaeota archaeon]|nr:alpha-L-rhamnosidase N-terminal domain-containing protein [Candidatus Bathyarchaeota archaeon]